MQSWIQRYPLFILSAFVILLILFSGYQSYQISELQTSNETLDKKLSGLTSAYNSHKSISFKKMDETNEELDSLISNYNTHRSTAAKELKEVQRNLSRNVDSAIEFHELFKHPYKY